MPVSLVESISRSLGCAGTVVNCSVGNLGGAYFVHGSFKKVDGGLGSLCMSRERKWGSEKLV